MTSGECVALAAMIAGADAERVKSFALVLMMDCGQCEEVHPLVTSPTYEPMMVVGMFAAGIEHVVSSTIKDKP